jgi:sterol 3beta-glucosyltransferase
VAKMVVYSCGYRGDILPYVPIASQLSRRGHDVTFVVPAELHDMFAGEPFRCVDADAGDLTPTGLDRHADYVARWGRRFSGAMMLRLYLGQLAIPRLDRLVQAVDDELDGADLVVSHAATSLIARIACEQRGLPWIVGDLFPMLNPTASHRPLGGPSRRTPNRTTGALNRLAWRSAQGAPARWLSCEQGFARYRAQHGLPTDHGYVLQGRLSPHHNVGLVSPHYYPPAPDWPDTYRMVGFTPWTSTDETLPDDVKEFIAGGDAPVLVMLGSAGAGAHRDLLPGIATALDRLGLRGVYLTSTADRALALADRPGVWPYVPLRPLLPHVRAVVHSGAHGRNSLALAAGKPSVVVPQLFDQEWHGRRQASLGTGILVNRRQTPTRLERAIERVITDDSYTRRAQEMAAVLDEEDGTTIACDQIEEFLNR